jgi:hypothetical protein
MQDLVISELGEALRKKGMQLDQAQLGDIFSAIDTNGGVCVCVCVCNLCLLEYAFTMMGSPC